MRQYKYVVACQHQTALCALLGKRCLAIQCRNVLRARMAAVRPPGQQHAKLFKAFADRGDGLRQVQVALGGAARRLRIRRRIGGVNAATWEHIGTGRKARRHGAPRHQHFNAVLGVT